MAYKIGTTTQGSTGLKTINLGTPSTPTAVTFVVQNKYGVNEGTVRHVSMGTASASGQRCTSYLKDGAMTFDSDTTLKCISLYEWVGGVATEVLSASFDSFTATGVKINVTIANNAYLIYLRADY